MLPQAISSTAPTAAKSARIGDANIADELVAKRNHVHRPPGVEIGLLSNELCHDSGQLGLCLIASDAALQPAESRRGCGPRIDEPESPCWNGM